MQPTPIARNVPTELIERLELNRRILRDTAVRLAAVRVESRRARARCVTLCREVRSGLDLAATRIATSRDWRPGDAVIVRPTVHRYVPGAADPLDLARQELHEAYAATRDPRLRDQLMQSYDGFARSLALRFRHREAVDDLMQVARIGLLHAIDRFDPGLGRPFPLFARITISGELKRHIRDRTWAMRVPRSLQEDYLDIMRAVDELTAEFSDSPSMEILAERCDMSVERVVEALELRGSQRPLSIDAPAGSGPDDPVIELGRDDPGFRSLENRDLLANLLARLPERDRRIIELRFMKEMTQSEIAQEIGVSQMCVSRVLARTLGRLRLWARTATN